MPGVSLHPAGAAAMHNLLREWLGHLAVEAAASPHTLAAYRRDVERFLVACAAGGLVHAAELNADTVRAHVAALSHTLGSRSVARHLYAIRSWLHYLRETGRIDRDIAELVELPRQPERLPQTLNTVDVVAMIDTARERVSVQYGDARPNRLALRDAAILETLFATGARQGELAGLRLDDVNLAEGWVRLFGKGGKERMVPLGRKAVRAIEAYVKHCRADLTHGPNEALFLSKSGEPMDPSALYRLVQRTAAAAGLGQRVGPHRLRHAFATALLDGGANLRVVQELLGHARVTTTEIYTHVSAARLAAVHAACHPLGRRRVGTTSPPRPRRSKRRR